MCILVCACLALFTVTDPTDSRICAWQAHGARVIAHFDLTQRENLVTAWYDNKEIFAHAMAEYIYCVWRGKWGYNPRGADWIVLKER